MRDTLLLCRWSCSIPCQCRLKKNNLTGVIVELSFARALVARPSTIPLLGSRITIQLGAEAAGIKFVGETAYVQRKPRALFGIEMAGNPGKNLDKLKRLLPFFSHPSTGQPHATKQKRSFYRWNLDVPSQFECQNRVTQCTAVDISYGGAMLEARELPPEGAEIQLTLFGETLSPIKARVVRTQTDSGAVVSRGHFGVEFLASPDEKRRCLAPLLQGCVRTLI